MTYYSLFLSISTTFICGEESQLHISMCVIYLIVDKSYVIYPEQGKSTWNWRIACLFSCTASNDVWLDKYELVLLRYKQMTDDYWFDARKKEKKKLRWNFVDSQWQIQLLFSPSLHMKHGIINFLKEKIMMMEV
jgi:hypothetical protein